MNTQGNTQHARCACGRAVRWARVSRMGGVVVCATCAGATDGRSDARTSVGLIHNDGDARIAFGDAGVYGARATACAHRGVCRHAARADVGIGYAWNARRGAYDLTPVGQTEPIPTHTRDHTPHTRGYVGVRAGVCERCDRTRDEHTDGTCDYAPRVDAIAGDARAFVVDDVAAYVAAFRARSVQTRTRATMHTQRAASGDAHGDRG